MGILFDLLKDIPTNAVLREKMQAIEEKYAALETENAILKDDNRKLKADKVQLEQEIKRLTHKDSLDEVSHKILAYMAEADGFVDDSDLEGLLQLPAARVKHHMDKLESQDYVDGKHYAGGAVSLYSLTPKGREYVVSNNLI